MANSALETLRDNTRSIHKDLEELLEHYGFLRTTRGVATHLSTLLRHHQALAQRVPQRDLQELVFERVDELASDIARLGGRPAFCRATSPANPPYSLAQSLGHVYVVEGSRLGAMTIAKQLQRVGIDTANLRSIGGDPHAVRERWAAFSSRLDALPRDTWTDAGNAAFESFHALMQSYGALTPHHREVSP
jgi:heme oxygenase